MLNQCNNYAAIVTVPQTSCDKGWQNDQYKKYCKSNWWSFQRNTVVFTGITWRKDRDLETQILDDNN